MNYRLNTTRKNLLYTVTLFLLSITLNSLFIIHKGQAAEVFMIAPAQVGVSQDFQVDLLLDTEMENINAVEGKVIFDSEDLVLKEIRNTDSVVTLWVKDPASSVMQSPIEFAGITPGGYNSRGQKGKILSLVFTAQKEGETSIKIENAQALLNDGQGTKTTTRTKFTALSITTDITTPSTVQTITDTESPEPLFAEIIQDKSIEENKWVVVFYTHDKSSGISHYEVAEQKIGELSDYSKLHWQTVQSPYRLRDQRRHSFVYVKAVDKAGNEVVSVLPPNQGQPAYESMWFWCIIIVLLLLSIGGYVWRRQKKINS